MRLNSDNKFFSFMSLLGDLIFLNLLFVVTSIPVVTFGASSSALYAVIKKRLNGEESYVGRDYFNAWKENLKNGLCIWCILLAALLGMLIFSSYIATHSVIVFVVIIYCALFMTLAFILLYAFPLQATFINTPLKIIRNSLITALGHLPWTFFLFFTTYTPIALTLTFPGAIYFTAVYWLFIGFSLMTVFSLFATKRVFAVYIAKEISEETTN